MTKGASIEQVRKECVEALKAWLRQYIGQPAPELLAELRKTLAEWEAGEPAQYEALTETKPDGTVCVSVELPDPIPPPFMMEFTLSKAEDEKP